jgi:L-fuconolactonase
MKKGGNMDKFNAEWLAQYRKEILEPDLKICDAHHHLWNYPSYQYMSEDLLANIGNGLQGRDHNVVSTIYMEYMWDYDRTAEEHLRSVGESRFVFEEKQKYQNSKTQICITIVGNTNLCGDKVGEVLDTHLAANPKLKEML